MFIDPHVHLRDFRQRHKETIKHGLEVARDSGLDAVFDMPNTDPAILTRELVVERLKIAKAAAVPEVFYGLYLGLTSDTEQVKRAVAAYHQFPQVIGFKLYAGHSVGDLGVVKEFDQWQVYHTLAKEGFEGVIAVHCEKESELRPDLWAPERPVTHNAARPPIAEQESVEDQIGMVIETGFKGKLHIAHISTPRAVRAVEYARKRDVDISAGVCPHHLFLDLHCMFSPQGLLYKANPPVRDGGMGKSLLESLKGGEIDWVETDHAPHTLDEKMQAPYMSGIPGLAWWPLFAYLLERNGFTEQQLDDVMFTNAQKRFGLDIKQARRPLVDHRREYAFDPYGKIAEDLAWQWPA